MNKNFNAGDIVLSCKGRDAGRHYVIVSLEDAFAYIANGKLRRAEKPKRKKLVHLEGTGRTYEDLTGKQFDKEKITNPALKKAIALFKNRDL